MQYPSKAQNDWKAEQTSYETAREYGLRQIYADPVFQIIPRSMANDKSIEELCCEFLQTTSSSLSGGIRQFPPGYVAPSLSTFRSVVESDPSILKGQHLIYIESIDRQRAKVIDQIEELLTGIQNPADLKNELGKLRFQSLEQVIARRQQIVEAQRLSKLSTTAIRSELKAGRPEPHRWMPYDLLPADLTANELKTILRSHKANLYLRKFGSKQLNARLFGES